MTNKGKEQAFPLLVQYPNSHLNPINGLTKREWLAGMAMNGLLSDSEIVKEIHRNEENVYQKIPLFSVQMAEALLAELEKTNE